jgi:DNA/RNA-binding domain of Phe-tRNA-synthetase-like protein
MFSYDDAVAEQYPGIHAGVILATGLVNGSSSPELVAAFMAEQAAVTARLQGTELAEIPSIAAWRRAFTRFGAKPTQYRNAAESLLRRLSKQGDIPTISTLVDMGNLISIRYALPVAIFDRDQIAGEITVRLATGAEPFADLGSSESVHPDPGEVIFVDDRNDVSARRWCWRQSAKSATNPSTVNALIVIEGHHESAESDIQAAVTDMTALLEIYQPTSTFTTFALSAAEPRRGETLTRS